MQDQYFGIKELYELTLKAKTPMQFGSRYIEVGEPVLYFENVLMSVLSEKNNVVFARGGWSNLPRVIWEDRTEVQFSLSEGILSSISMGILFGANVSERKPDEPLLVPRREGPYNLVNGCLWLERKPVVKLPETKVFILKYKNKVAQEKAYGKLIEESENGYKLKVYGNKECTVDADPDAEYIVDYYYQYNDDALIYTIKKERFNGLFTLEGKFYSKDENEGIDTVNLIYMPKVRVISDINLRLGERADPTMSVFNIIGLPEQTTDKKNLILEITRLGDEIR